MKLALESGEGSYLIRSYEAGCITINETPYYTNIILSLDTLEHSWPVTDSASLRPGDLEPALALNPEIVLLGTGPEQIFPPREVMRSLVARGVGIEVMDTGSAARTFNVLMAEGRRLAAGLIV